MVIEILPIFSLTVSGLLLSRRGARLMVALALFLQICAIAVEVAALGGGLPAFHSAGGSLVTRMVVTGLIAGVGLGFITAGAVLRDYQNEIAERSRVEVRLTELVRHKNNLINSVTHELRTPLTAVFGFSQALGDAALNLGEMDRFALARTVADESRRLVNVVDNLIVEALG
ncbi:MAG: histidine kinase dimerization/phospho-acceptor domain-containing protein [Acidimicrobiia bacterium]